MIIKCIIIPLMSCVAWLNTTFYSDTQCRGQTADRRCEWWLISWSVNSQLIMEILTIQAWCFINLSYNLQGAMTSGASSSQALQTCRAQWWPCSCTASCGAHHQATDMRIAMSGFLRWLSYQPENSAKLLGHVLHRKLASPLALICHTGMTHSSISNTEKIVCKNVWWYPAM